MKLPKPTAPEDDDGEEKPKDSDVPLPQTLVRIPVEPEQQLGEAQHDAGNER